MPSEQEKDQGLRKLRFHHESHPHPYKPSADLSGLYVVTVISNPVRFKRRYELYWTFQEMCAAADVKLITVEQQFGERPFMVTESHNPLHVQVRSSDELWHKENMLNLGVARAATLPTHAYPKCRYVAWVDADCRPARHPRAWFEETWHQLQHYAFVQMWEQMLDLDLETNAASGAQPSFVANYIKYGSPNPEEFKALKAEAAEQAKCYPSGHGTTLFGRPGLAWASTIEAWRHVGGLVDYCILGAADWYMAHALVGSLRNVLSKQASLSNGGQYPSAAIERKLLIWQERAERWIKRDVGYVPGLLYHDYHGPKALRGYGTRGRILVDNRFDPDIDLKYDEQGLLQLEVFEPRQIKMRDQIRAYFRSRNEDAS